MPFPIINIAPGQGAPSPQSPLVAFDPVQPGPRYTPLNMDGETAARLALVKQGYGLPAKAGLPPMIAGGSLRDPEAQMLDQARARQMATQVQRDRAARYLPVPPGGGGNLTPLAQ